MIPKILHYCFGMADNSEGKAWSLVHYACLRSAIERIRPTVANLYCEHEPAGPWWELSKPMIQVHRVTAPREIFGNPVMHFAHRADIVRLERLLGEGGIYLDADVFVHRNFDDLLGHQAVLGRQLVDGGKPGLCNAVILAERGASFLQRWHGEYRWFRSKGRDEFWDEHSVQVPLKLAEQFPDELTILPNKAFFWPTFTEPDMGLMFDSTKPLELPGAYATHLWESIAWESYLEQLTPRRVRSSPTNFHRWVAPMLESVPDDYGAPSVKQRFVRGVRQLKRRVRSVIPL